MNRRVATAIVFLALCSRIAAAQGPPDVPKATASTGSQAAYVVEQKHLSVKFEADGSFRRELTLRVKVNDEQAVRAWGQLPLPYNSGSEQLELPNVEVHKPDGSVIKTAQGAIQDLAVAPFPQLPVFLDLRQKMITVAALGPGDVLLVDAVWTTTHPVIPGQFFFAHVFAKSEAVLDERLEIDVPADKPLLIKTRPEAPPEENGGKGTLLGARRVYRWKSANAVAPKENAPSSENAPPPDVRLTTFSNWDEVGRWYRTLVPKADPIVDAKAAELTKGRADLAGRINAIYKYVSTEIRYVSLSFGLGRYAPHGPAEVLANKYGDCKDKATLLTALLAAAGIDSAPVLVNTTRSVDDDMPSPLEFDHMITFVPRGNDSGPVWLDSTIEVAPAGMLIPPVRNRKGLLIGNAGTTSRLVTTPVDPPFAPVNRFEFEGRVNDIGVLTTRVKHTLHSDNELIGRVALRALARESWPEFVQAFAKAMGLEGGISEVNASDPVDTERPLQISFSLRTASFLNWAAASSEVRIPSSVTRLPGWTDDERKGVTSVKLGTPMLLLVHGTIELPAGYSIDAPVPVTASGPGLEYRSSYSVDGARLTIDRELKTSIRDIPSERFGAYSSFVRAVDADAAQPVHVKSTVVATPAVPPDATAAEVYYAALCAYQASKYEAAVTLWKRTAELDPKMGDAWISLGLAYNQLKKYDDAAAAIRKQIALDPYNKRAYSDLGHVLWSAGKLEDAAKAYAKHVDLNPLDGDSLRVLGEIYWDLGRDADAAAALSKATSLVKEDAWVFALLGGAYLHLHAREKATTAFDKAIAIEPSARILTKVAWTLADGGVDLDRALDLATRAIGKFSEETRNLTLASIADTHLDLMERLAWAWDAVAWVQFQKGNFAEAERYARAAWLLGGNSPMAYHLGRVYEKLDRLADALSYYLTAQAISARPMPEIMTHIKRLSGGGDLGMMIASAKEMSRADRTFKLTARGPAGRARFLAVAGPDRHAIELRFTDGQDPLRALEPELRRSTLPLEFPGDVPLRLLVGIATVCSPERGCSASVLYPDDVTLPASSLTAPR